VTIGIATLAAAILLQQIIRSGLVAAAAAASAALIDALVLAGYEGAAALVSGSFIASAGATLIAGGLAIAIFFALEALADILFRKYYLIVEVTNFDGQNNWISSPSWYSDNALVSNDTWKVNTINQYQPPGPVNSPPPGIYEPINAIDGIVTFMTAVFENDSIFFEGLGIAFSCATQNPPTTGYSLKYRVNRFADNDLGLISEVPSDLTGFYEDLRSWTVATTATTVVATSLNESININASTPALGSADNNVYRFDIEIRPQ